MSRVREIIFYGKSGDNLQNVTDKLVQSLIKRGLYVTAYSDYDPERRESVAKVHVRIADGPIDVRGPVIAPEIAVFMDFRLLGRAVEVSSVRKLIVNAPNRELVAKYISNNNTEVHTINLYSLIKTGNDYTSPLIDTIIKTLNT